MDHSPWNLLHDGRIIGITGTVPGDLALQVSIAYLRARFPGEGSCFVVHVLNCTHFSFEPYDGTALSGLSAIANLQPEILSVEIRDPVEVACVNGTLYLHYDSTRVFLDSGIEISLSDLDLACRDYWDDWSARAKGAP